MRKENRTYYFSVEGDTEKWYLDWLQQMINKESDIKYTVKLDSKKEKDPLSRVKRMTIIGKTEITHIFDYESDEEFHVKQFKGVLDTMKSAQNTGKRIKYNLGYSNFTFELWMILHKMDSNKSYTHRSKYLEPINRAFGERFKSLDEYKEEKNFKKILDKLTLQNVKQAIERSKSIMKRNEDLDYKLQEYKGYKYYRENPSLSIWEQIERILKDCGIL